MHGDVAAGVRARVKSRFLLTIDCALLGPGILHEV